MSNQKKDDRQKKDAPKESLEDKLDEQADARAAVEEGESVADEDAAVIADARAGRIPEP